MKEDLLHFIWKYKKLQLDDLLGTRNEPIGIFDTGTHNHLAGPDFFNARVHIDGQLWAGNVEIHLKSSDWYAHHHEKDTNYNNVILHVVWEDDASVFRSDNSEIPTLELKNYIPQGVLDAYQKLFDKNGVQFINCEKNIGDVDTFLFENWLERLYFERLERKSKWVFTLLESSKNDWEQVLFAMLLKNFGLKINGASFLSLAQALDFSTVRKLQSSTLALESVFYGMSHLLDSKEILDDYYIRLKEEYFHLKNKFGLEQRSVQKPEFFKLRPPNFPTIRLSQLANLYTKRQNLFSRVIHASQLVELYEIFEVSASGYWNEHFTFGKTSKKSSKRLTKSFIDLLIINTLLPLKFCYARHQGKDANEDILQIISQIQKEENSIITNFKHQGLSIANAKESQAILQLYNEYCTQNKCLQCAVGNSLLRANG
ncbi:Protein of unknown function [Pricia antarctica]|uniref:DUF2851 domain-containing protein n=1 Tax=Pricia antarctica TaxID=641691 RepID=A0A1G7GEU3_9FLAO|nr:DUF2851 family protein [Pricia antarctica]SDE86646.1 Protein of unknown function [Pricia antarctica]